MSWLYEHRHQMDGLCPLVEIAYWTVTPHVPPEDRDDVEQEIVIELMQAVEKYGDKVGIDVHILSSGGKNYLKKVAVNKRNDYFLRKHREWSLWHIEVIDCGEWVGRTSLVSHDIDLDARLDARATLATLPERLIQIGQKLLNGEKLSVADQAYRVIQMRKLRPKLNCRKRANRLSDRERKRILLLYRGDLSVHKIATTMGRTHTTIKRVLGGQLLLSVRRQRLASERDERIRHAYFVDGKSTSMIARDFHHGIDTVYRAIRQKKEEEEKKAAPRKEAQLEESCRPALFDS
ncbi:hypothetical protein ES703_24818 [subsurface metagenome]